MATEDGQQTEGTLSVSVDYDPGRIGERLLALDDEYLVILLILMLTFATTAFLSVTYLLAT